MDVACGCPLYDSYFCVSACSHLFDLDNLSKHGISHLNLPRFVSEYSRSLEARGFESQKKESGRLTVVRNNGGGQKVYRLEGSTQELLNDDRKVAEHMTMTCSAPNKSREHRKDQSPV
jgi:hypothetical protein